MSRKKETIRVSILFVIIFSGFVLAKPDKIDSTTEPFFTLKALTGGGAIRSDLLFFLKQHCARIGIHIEVYSLEWGLFVTELYSIFHDFDIYCVSLVGNAGDPGPWIRAYGEDGALNFGGYNTSMDWDDELGTGINEWYLQTGETMMASESEERVQHYWEWQDYMMDKILPIQPAFVAKRFFATWSNLQGYNCKEGLLASWGNMTFTGLHTGQNSQDEVIISGGDWQNLNPLFLTGANYEMSNLILDRAIWFDYQLNVHPHLATSVSMINDTHIRISIREGIKWHTDPDGLFTNEYVDVDDFYFTYYAWKHIADDKHFYKWIEDIVKVDQYTLDIFVDSDQTSIVNEPYAPFMKYLEVAILPEHYLNQTQLPDGQTPDIIDSSWDKFSTDVFGTGLFELYSHDEGVQTTLLVVDDCWYLDPLVDKSDMDFTNRFGDFTGGLNELRIRAIRNRITEITEFELGKIDIVSISGLLDKKDEYTQSPDFEVQSSFLANLLFYGYNMRKDRANIGSWEPCESDPSITKGLAIRKAISYALDRYEINNVLFRGEYDVTDYPIYEALGKWCNPNIIRYNHDLEKAREYMALAGFTDFVPPRLDGWEITGIVLASIFIVGTITFVFYRINKKVK